MARGPTIFQGADKSFVFESGTDLTSATEIEFTIDTPTQIKKTLGGGGVNNVTATQFQVDIASADTESVESGGYKYQVRATIGGLLRQGKFKPNRFTILDSVFTDIGSGNDYN
jgi:hypothetical protein